MTQFRVILLVIVCSSFGTLGGAVAGYYAALTTPTSSSVAVLDVEELVSKVDQKAPDYMQRAQAVSNRAKAVTQRLTSAGIVVIDRAHVIAAPEDAIIHISVDEK